MRSDERQGLNEILDRIYQISVDIDVTRKDLDKQILEFRENNLTT